MKDFDSELVVTIDIEWSPQELIEHVLDILKDYKITATLFATHKAELGNMHEIALHPFYNSEKSYQNTFNKLMELFPHAKGVRSHRLLTDETLLLMYKERRIRYTSNYMMTNMSGISPINTIHGIFEIPIYYIDWSHLMGKKFYKKKFSLEVLNLQYPGLKVFDFHPLHVFLNSEKMERYEKVKKFYNNPKELKGYINNKTKGIGTLFIELLEFIKKNRIRNCTMLEICNKYSKV